MEKQSKVILVYGCPGSGKTTFSKDIAKYFKAQVISGDHVQTLVATYGIHKVQTDIIKMVECQDTLNTKVQFSTETWKQSRELIKQHLAQLVNRFSTIILEDDFLLKSQRKNIRHVCQRQKIQLAEILMDSSVEQCLINNKKRVNSLPDAVIRDKHQKLEYDDRGIRLKVDERTINEQLVGRIYKILKVPVQIIHESLPIEQRTLQLTEIQIRKTISDIMKSQNKLSELFGVPLSGNMKKCSQYLSTYKKKYDLTLGAQAFLPTFRIWLSQHL